MFGTTEGSDHPTFMPFSEPGIVYLFAFEQIGLSVVEFSHLSERFPSRL